ncbi:hypothetical protein GCM10010303_40800 [Streptomyces purpurascens]|nr:hypothetical protein GCM10010303_40800 [Streptomyces purpurascens]
MERLEREPARNKAALEGMGKLPRSWRDLRERGLTHAAEPVTDDAFAGVEDALDITAACRLTGRARATPYRRLRPSPAPRPRKPQVQHWGPLTAEAR